MFLQFLLLKILLISLEFTKFPYSTETILTKKGKIKNIVTRTKNGTTYRAFLGIPYAKPPIDSLRFMPPEPADNFISIYDATYERDVCVQNAYDGNFTIKGSEDCLHLSVYTPKISDYDPLFPVLIWLAGGEYMYNSGNLGLYGPSKFIDKNIIVVTINSRLGVFGFLSTEDNACPGNNALRDVILALQWVKDNIKDYGGNSNKITLMGQSAGAATVTHLMLAPQTKGLFHQAICQSGDALMPWTVPIMQPRELAFKIGLANNINTTNSTELITKLQAIKAVNLQNSTISLVLKTLLFMANGLLFAPVIEPNSPEAVVTGESYEKYANGSFAQIPILRGYNLLEARIYLRTNRELINTVLVNDSIVPEHLIPFDMNINASDISTVANMIKTKYFGNNSTDPDFFKHFIEFASDNGFARATIKATELQSNYCPVYLYCFNYTGGSTHVPFIPEGAEHKEELQFIWLTSYDFQPVIQTTDEAKTVSNGIVTMWANFVKYGHPTPFWDKSVNVQWSTANSKSDGKLSYLNIDKEFTMMLEPKKDIMDFWNELFSRFANKPLNTY